ncbi:hypothetical protein ACFQ4Z_12145 [Oceanobacillus oncorhynchi subsp. oncorhynchi]|uniref:hypothetical protein n=1 Tax=Oceanobacillus oncorhynchi TaxID=545501 RepID=UPI0036265FAB
MEGLPKRLKRLGFIADLPETVKGKEHYYYQAYVKDLSNNTSLIIEGYRKEGYPTYRFTFYKATYIKGGGKVQEKIYLYNASPIKMMQKVTSFVNHLERSK